MQTLTLTPTTPSIIFQLNAPDSFVRISTVSLAQEDTNKTHWAQLSTMIQLRGKLLCKASKNNVINSPALLEKTFPIHLFIDPNQTQPVFEINKTINNQIIIDDLKTASDYYTHLIIECIEMQTINENYAVQLVVEQFNAHHSY